MSGNEVELLKGTLDVLILKTLTWGPAHGYAVSSWIRHVTDHALQVEEGALYPALHRLERKRLVEAEWGVSENKRRAKFYRLTPLGRLHLDDRAAGWTRSAEAVGRVLNASERPAWASRSS